MPGNCNNNTALAYNKYERKNRLKLLSSLIPVEISTINLWAFLLAAQLISPLPALAFPCSKASTKVERVICAKPEIKQADDAMEKVYFSLRDNLAPESADMLKSSQKNWLKYRNITCLAEPNCLRAETQSRTEVLAEISRYQPDLVPVFIWQLGGKNAYSLKFDGVKFSYPNTGDQSAGRSAFNREVDRQIAKMPWGEKTENQTISSWEQEINLRINQLSRKMISATATTYDYSGGAHPNSWSNSININLQTARSMKTSDLFSNKSIEVLISDCRDIIIKEKSSRFGDTIEESRTEIEESYPGAVKAHVGDMARWRFTYENISIDFDSYAIGPYAAGPFSCEFSTGYIKNLASNSEILER